MTASKGALTAALTLLALFLFLANPSYAAIENEFKLACSGENCLIQFHVEDGTEYSFPLIPAKSQSIFSDSLVIKHNGVSVSNLATNSADVHFHATSGFGAATIERVESGKDVLKHGVFVTKDHGTIEFQRSVRVSGSLRGNRRRLFTNNRGSPWIDPVLFVDSNKPGDCFPDDNLVHLATFSIIADAGFAEKAFGSETNSESQRQLVLAEIEDVLSLARMIWTVQLNVRFEIGFVEIGSNSSAAPISWSPNSGCGLASDAYNKLIKYVNGNPNENWGAIAFMLSECFGNTDFGGIALTNSFCLSGSKGVGLSVADPVTAAHELGHLFGASHSLENGVGTTGGIMDVGGSGYYLDSQQFHPGKKSELCNSLTSTKTTRNCAFFVALSNSTCGDGILSPDEECECIQSSDKNSITSCRDCEMCEITSNAECSLDSVFRQPTDKGHVRVQESMLATPACCVNGTVPIATTCNGGKDMCSLGGYCNPVCSTLGFTPCGSGASGCKQRCLVFGQCVEAHSRLTARNVSLNAVLDGSNCYLIPGTDLEGTCYNGICYSIGEDDDDPGSLLTRIPSQVPSARPQSLPATEPTVTPTFPTTASPTKKQNCAPFRRRAVCNRQTGCAWSKNRCVVARLQKVL